MVRSKSVFVMLFVCLCSGFVFGASGNIPGSGSLADPYLIQDFDDFDAFCNDTGKWASGVYTKLTCDLDLDPTLIGRQTYTQAPIAGDTNYNFDGTAYQGYFDGDGHIISNLTIDGTYHYGLVGYLETGGSITNLALEDADVRGSGFYASGLVGIKIPPMNGVNIRL